MKKKPYSSSLKSGTLTRSRTYIVVPRDVPPENFISVTETRKVRKVGILRCCFPPLAVTFLVACLLAGVGFLIYRYNIVTTTDWPGGSLKSLTSTPDCHLTEWGCCPDNVTVRTDKSMDSCLTHCVQGDCTTTVQPELCKAGYWGSAAEGGCSACLCSALGSTSDRCSPTTGQCNCRSAYTGHKCNICLSGAAQKYGGCEETQSIDSGTPCSSQPCQGGGQCEEHDGTFTCYCTQDRSGKYCEKEISRTDLDIASFTGNSFVELKPILRSVTRTSISLSFRSFALDGLLLHTETAKHQFIRLRLVSGLVEFSFSLGEEGALTLVAPSPVRTGEWHTVKAHRYHQDGMLVLDGQEPVTGTAPTHQKTLKVSNHTFIGFSPLDDTMGFRGCIKDLEFSHNPVSLISSREPLLVRSVELSDCSRHVCSAMPCKNSGECISDSSGFKCKCVDGFFGDRCSGSRTACSPNPCEGGATCTNLQNQVVCLCPPGRRGLLCQEDEDEGERDFQADQGQGHDSPLLGLKQGEELMLRLDGTHLYSIPTGSNTRLTGERLLDLTLIIRTREEAGVIMYTNEQNRTFTDKKASITDSLELGLVAGRLVLRAHMTSPGGVVGRGVAVSRDRVDDGAWHTAVVKRNGRRLYVRLDEKEVMRAEVSSPGDPTDQTYPAGQSGALLIWIGGRAPTRSLTPHPFVGDIKNIIINGAKITEQTLKANGQTLKTNGKY